MTNVGNVVITGGASGLGAATARAVAESGGRPLVIDIKKPADVPDYVLADLADREATEDAVSRLSQQVDGQLHGVFTAAGIDAPGRLSDVSAKEWERVVQVNLLGAVAVIRAALPHLERTGGTVVTCASTLGIKALSDATAYCAAKFGVVGFTRALGAETAGRIGVTLLLPGGMDTPFFDGRQQQYKPGPEARLNDPAHVAAAVIFALTQPAGCEVREMVICASEESSWP